MLNYRMVTIINHPPGITIDSWYGLHSQSRVVYDIVIPTFHYISYISTSFCLVMKNILNSKVTILTIPQVTNMGITMPQTTLIFDGLYHPTHKNGEWGMVYDIAIPTL